MSADHLPHSSASRFTAGAAGAALSSGSDILNAKLLRPPRQEFVELRLGGPDNLVLQHLYQPVDRGIADYRLEHPVVLVLQVYEHRERFLPLLKDGNERDHVVRHDCTPLRFWFPDGGRLAGDAGDELHEQLRQFEVVDRVENSK